MPKEFDFDKEFENMMTSNKLDTVVLLGHINPDGDAAGSVRERIASQIFAEFGFALLYSRS